jgi:hypothetical protein
MSLSQNPGKQPNTVKPGIEKNERNLVRLE